MKEGLQVLESQQLPFSLDKEGKGHRLSCLQKKHFDTGFVRVVSKSIRGLNNLPVCYRFQGIQNGLISLF